MTPAPPKKRVPLHRPLTPMEGTVVTLVGKGYTYAQAAQALGKSTRTIRMYCENAAAKIPGTVPCLAKIVLWWQGHTAETLYSYAHGRRVGPVEEAECRRPPDPPVAPSSHPQRRTV